MILTKTELQNKDIPHDLESAIKNFDCVEDLFDEMECEFLDGENVPTLISHSYLSDNDKKDMVLMANVAAIDVLFTYISFIVETADSELVGYWHGPEKLELKKSPIIKYTNDGQFKILEGANIIEALVCDYSYEEEDYLELQECFAECGVKLASNWDDLVEEEPKTHPEKLHEHLFEKFKKESS